jgi:hypothetical protein
MANVITAQNLGNEFDLGTIEANKIHVKLDGTSLVRDAVTGVISAVPSSDTFVEEVSWNPTTNELTITMNDASEHTVSLATLAADKFLQGSSYDPDTATLTLTMSDSSEYQINLSDLVTVQAGYGLTGDGTSGTPIEFAASTLPVTDEGNVDQADMFLMATDPYPNGSRVSIGHAAEQVLGHLRQGGSFEAALEEFLTVEVTDAFGNHLFFALP